MPQYGVNTPVRRESYVLLVVYVGEHTLRGETEPRSVWLGGYTPDAQGYCNLKRQEWGTCQIVASERGEWQIPPKDRTQSYRRLFKLKHAMERDVDLKDLSFDGESWHRVDARWVRRKNMLDIRPLGASTAQRKARLHTILRRIKASVPLPEGGHYEKTVRPPVVFFARG